ncbi:MAG TPA: DUF2252 family protein [Pyrinomonadaceae bacterium]|jgi:hypothetical protein
MDIHAATQSYEAWLTRQTDVSAADLECKHEQMRNDTSPFPFLRATFYRWAQLWPEVCAELTDAPQVLAVGDLHIENFGTWRDREGRLAWGVNDFDEAGRLPYTSDLVRLATSARLAAAAEHIELTPKDACAALLAGYTAGLEDGARPFILAERHRRLRAMIDAKHRDPTAFWQELDALPAVNTDELPAGNAGVLAEACAAIEALWPEPGVNYRLVRRVAGLGSLGRQRFAGLGAWRGGRLAREAKALVPSSLVWAGINEEGSPGCAQALAQAVRAPDPFLRVQGRWLVRRLAPDCQRIDLKALAKRRDEYRLLRAMGRETANVHLGSPAAAPLIAADLSRRPARWLHTNAQRMAQATITDWQHWRQAG